MAAPVIRDATRCESKASIVIEGLQGSGKSGLALDIAHALTGDWSKIGAVDSENRSLDLFEGLNMSSGVSCAPFKKADLTDEYGFIPSMYLELREDFINMGCEAVIFDSISHAWIGTDGILDRVNRLEAENTKINKFNAWGRPEVLPEKNKLPSLVRDPRVHMISTVRLKEKFIMETGEGVKSIGEQQVMQDGLKYEPDLLLRMVSPGNPDGTPAVASVEKTRYAFLRRGQVYTFTPELLQQIKDYLTEGVDPATLIERQFNDYVVSITDLVKDNKTQQTKLSMTKRRMGIDPATKLKDMTLTQLQVIYNQLQV